MPKPGYFDGTEAQVVLEPSSFARELAASARAWADATRGGGAAAASTAEAAPPPPTTQPPPALLPPLAEARGRDPRSAHPGGWVRVRVVDSCTASGPEGGLRFCVEIAAGGEGEGEKEEPKKRRWLPLAWLHPSNPKPLLAVRPLPPPPSETDEKEAGPSWSAGDEAEIKKGGGSGGGGGRGGGSWWPATILDVKEDDDDAAAAGDGGGGGGGGDGGGNPRPAQNLVVRIEPCWCYPTGAVVNVSTSGAATAAANSNPHSSSSSSSTSYSVRRRPPLPPLFEEEAARLQLEQERAERSGRMSGGFGSRGGVLGSGRRWSGMATSFGENVHPEEWRRRTAGLLAEEEEEEGEGEKNGGGGGVGMRALAAAAGGGAAGSSAGVSSGARTHLIAGFSMEAALCPGQLSTATREGEEEGEEEKEGGEKEDEKRYGEGQPPQPKKRKLSSRTNRDPFDYDGSARALLEAGGSL